MFEAYWHCDSLYFAILPTLMTLSYNFAAHKLVPTAMSDNPDPHKNN